MIGIFFERDGTICVSEIVAAPAVVSIFVNDCLGGYLFRADRRRESFGNNAEDLFSLVARRSGFPLPFDGIDRTDIVTGPAVGTDLLVNDLDDFLFPDGIHRAYLGTGPAIDAVLFDPMGPHQASPFPEVEEP